MIYQEVCLSGGGNVGRGKDLVLGWNKDVTSHSLHFIHKKIEAGKLNSAISSDRGELTKRRRVWVSIAWVWLKESCQTVPVIQQYSTPNLIAIDKIFGKGHEYSNGWCSMPGNCPAHGKAHEATSWDTDSSYCERSHIFDYSPTRVELYPT